MFRPVVPLVVLLLVPRPVPAAKPSVCPDGRFLLAEGVAVLAATGGARQGLTLADRTIAFDDSCEPAKVQLKATRRATRLLARWRTCGDRKKVLLKGTIAAPDCDTVRAVMKARKTPKVAFEAVRSRCGDDYADVAGGETCDHPADELAIDLLLAAADAIAGGATDVPLSPDGSLRFVRTITAGGGVDALIRGTSPLVRWEHDGDGTTATADIDGDGTPELRVEAVRMPVRSATVRLDLDDDGVVDRIVSITQGNGDGVEVEVTDAGQAPVGFSAPRLQELQAPAPAAGVTGENCTADEVTEAETALVNALTDGLACLHRFGMDAVGKTIAGKTVKDGVTFRCGATGDCAQVDVLDSLTHGLLPTTLGINLGAAFFSGGGVCADQPMVLFHELLHVGLGDWHSPSLDRTSKTSLATDRVYSCTDLCFRPAEATRRSCATCLGVDRCDAMCDGYADLPGDAPCGARVEVTQVTCPSQACSCCQDCPPGVLFTETGSGQASAPEGHFLRVNFLKSLGGQITCGSWSPVQCGAGNFDLLCCRREAGQPATTTFSATLPFPFLNTCVCPVPPPLDAGNVLAQIVTPGNDAIAEDSQPITCP